MTVCGLYVFVVQLFLRDIVQLIVSHHFQESPLFGKNNSLLLFTYRLSTIIERVKTVVFLLLLGFTYLFIFSFSYLQMLKLNLIRDLKEFKLNTGFNNAVEPKFSYSPVHWYEYTGCYQPAVRTELQMIQFSVLVLCTLTHKLMSPGCCIINKKDDS